MGHSTGVHHPDLEAVTGTVYPTAIITNRDGQCMDNEGNSGNPDHWSANTAGDLDLVTSG